MVTIQLTLEQYKNLMTFMTRVEMRGTEAIAWTDLMRVLQNPTVEEGVTSDDGKM